MHRTRTFERLDPRLLLAGDCGQHETDELAPEWVGDEGTIATDAMYAAADAGSTFRSAFDLGELGATQSYNGTVGGWDRVDVLRFTVSQESNVTIGLSALSADIDLYVYSNVAQRLAYSNAGGTASESISATFGAGTYYIAVVPWQRASSGYVLSVGATSTHAPPATDPPDDTPDDTPVAEFPDVAYYGGSNDWNLNAINAPESWAQGYTGNEIVVAVIDTGVDLFHPDLVNNIWVNPGEIAGNGIDDDANGFVDDVSGWDFAYGDNNPDDGNGHGTHVAGTIAADRNGFGATGIAPDATIMPVQVLTSSGYGTASAVAAGIRYAAANGADIINLSLGGGFSSVILSAIQYALQLDVLVVAAAGNESSATPGYPARFSATLSNVISAGAHSSSGTIASFSNDVGTSGAVQVDAPGVSIYSTYAGDGYARLSGTSMATPHVAGLAALALSANPNLTAAQLRTMIVAGAVRTIGGSDSAGGVNAAVTVALAAAGHPSTSTTPATVSSPSSTPAASVRQLMARSNQGPQALAALAGDTFDATRPAALAGQTPVSTASHESRTMLETLADHVLLATNFAAGDERDALPSDEDLGMDVDAWLDCLTGRFLDSLAGEIA